MSESEKLAEAEAFVRRAVRHFKSAPSEDEIKSAARKVFKALPPFKSYKTTKPR